MNNKPLRVDGTEDPLDEGVEDNPLLVTIEEHLDAPFDTKTSNITNRTHRLSFDRVTEILVAEMDRDSEIDRREALRGEVYTSQEPGNYLQRDMRVMQMEVHTLLRGFDQQHLGSDIFKDAKNPREADVSLSVRTLKDEGFHSVHEADTLDSVVRNRETIPKTKRITGDLVAGKDYEVINGLNVFRKKMGNCYLDKRGEKLMSPKSMHYVDYIYAVEQNRNQNNINAYQTVQVDEESSLADPRGGPEDSWNPRDIVLDIKSKLEEEEECRLSSSYMRRFTSEKNSVSRRSSEHIRKQDTEFYDDYLTTPNRPHEPRGEIVNRRNLKCLQDSFSEEVDEQGQRDVISEQDNVLEHDLNEHIFPIKWLPGDHHDLKILSGDGQRPESSRYQLGQQPIHFNESISINPFMANMTSKTTSKIDDSNPFLRIKASQTLDFKVDFSSLANKSEGDAERDDLDRVEDPRDSHSMDNKFYVESQSDEENSQMGFEGTKEKLPTIRESENESGDMLQSKLTKENMNKLSEINPLNHEFRNDTGQSDEDDEGDEDNYDGVEGYNQYEMDEDEFKRLYDQYENGERVNDSQYIAEDGCGDDESYNYLYTSDQIHISDGTSSKGNHYEPCYPNFVFQPHLADEDAQASYLMLAQANKINEFNQKRKLIQMIEQNQKSVASLFEELVRGELDAAKISSLIKATSQRIKNLQKAKVSSKLGNVMGNAEDMYEFVDLKSRQEE